MKKYSLNDFYFSPLIPHWKDHPLQDNPPDLFKDLLRSIEAGETHWYSVQFRNKYVEQSLHFDNPDRPYIDLRKFKNISVVYKDNQFVLGIHKPIYYVDPNKKIINTYRFESKDDLFDYIENNLFNIQIIYIENPNYIEPPTQPKPKTKVKKELKKQAEPKVVVDVGKVLKLMSDPDISISKLLELNPVEFEYLVAELFEKQGYLCKKTQYARDDGVDIFLFKDNKTTVVQCKRMNGLVTSRYIFELAGAKLFFEADQAIFVTTGWFSDNSHEKADKLGIKLIEGDELIKLISKLNNIEAVS